MDADATLAANREATRWFIESDPSVITLTPNGRVKSGNGAYKTQAGEPKPPQTVKIIFQDARGNAIGTSDGAVRKHEVVIVGNYDADIDEGDTFHWPPGDAKKWVVTGIHPDNGYEVKADAVVYGLGGPDA